VTGPTAPHPPFLAVRRPRCPPAHLGCRRRSVVCGGLWAANELQCVISREWWWPAASGSMVMASRPRSSVVVLAIRRLPFRAGRACHASWPWPTRA
jgi:hypothetical protein